MLRDRLAVEVKVEVEVGGGRRVGKGGLGVVELGDVEDDARKCTLWMHEEV